MPASHQASRSKNASQGRYTRVHIQAGSDVGLASASATPEDTCWEVCTVPKAWCERARSLVLLVGAPGLAVAALLFLLGAAIHTLETEAPAAASTHNRTRRHGHGDLEANGYMPTAASIHNLPPLPDALLDLLEERDAALVAAAEATAAEPRRRLLGITNNSASLVADRPPPSAAVVALGILSVICWCAVFMPQIALNHQRRGAAGLSLSSFLLWAYAGFAVTPYYLYEEGEVALLVQWMTMSVTSLVVVAQIYGYESFSSTPSWRRRWAKAAGLTACWTAVFTGWAVGSFYLFRAELDPALPVVFGSTIPTVTIAVGFLPQIWAFHQKQCGKAFSAGLALLDMGGCVFGALAWALDGQEAAGLAAYIVTFGLEIVMLCLKGFYRLKRRRRSGQATDGVAERANDIKA